MTPDTEGLRQAIVEAIAVMPPKEAGHLLNAVARAVLDRSAVYAGQPVDLMRLATHAGDLTVVVARATVAPMLAAAHEAIREALAAGGRT